MINLQNTTGVPIKDSMQLKHELKIFTGTEELFHHSPVLKLRYTDGVRFFFRFAGGGAYWFSDIVATEILDMVGRRFATITLEVKKGGVAIIIVGDGDGNTQWSKDIAFTDCPIGEWNFYLVDNTMMLPSEY